MVEKMIHRHNTVEYIEKRKKEFEEAEKTYKRSQPISLRKERLLERLKK